MPRLQNTDGDPLELRTLVFRVEDADAAVAALDSARLANLDWSSAPLELGRARPKRAGVAEFRSLKTLAIRRLAGSH